MSLTGDEERVLIRRAQVGDAEALGRLVEAHRPRIHYLARRYGCRGLTTRELAQEGVIGFLEAVSRFDPGQPHRLWTYARHGAKGRMIEACARWHGFSEEARRRYRRVVDAWEQLYPELAQEPSPQQIADASSVDLSTVQEVLAAWQGRQVHLLEDGEEDAAEAQAGPAGVAIPSPSPSPEALALRRATFARVTEILGPEDGPRWLLLFSLRDGSASSTYTWREIAEGLADPASPIAAIWPDLCDQFSLPPEVSRDWPEMCGRFETPPPLLTAQALRQWYHRGRLALRAEWTAGLVGKTTDVTIQPL